MKLFKKLAATVVIAAALSSSVFANGLSLNSIGTRALGMGGAFIGLASDGSAIYWNPAGLAGLTNRVYIYSTDIIPSPTYKFSAYGIDASAKSNHYISPNIFINYSMGDLAFGLGLYVPAGLGAEWNTPDFGYPSALGFELLSKIAVFNISPAVAYQVSDQLSIGVAVNIYYAMFDMKQPAQQDFSALGQGVKMGQYDESSTGLGFGATFGLKFQATKELSIGAALRLSTGVDMDGTAKNGLFPQIPNLPAYGIVPGPEESDFTRTVTWPMWIGGGIAYKATDKLTIVADAQYSKWSELDELVTHYDQAYWKAMTEPTEDNKFILNWENQVQLRFGAEYMFSDAFTGRVGFYTDPAPAPDETVNVLFPSSTNKVITGGLSYNTGSVAIDVAAEYLMGAEREVAPAAHNQPGIHQMDILAVSAGVSFGL